MTNKGWNKVYMVQVKRWGHRKSNLIFRLTQHAIDKFNGREGWEVVKIREVDPEDETEYKNLKILWNKFN